MYEYGLLFAFVCQVPAPETYEFARVTTFYFEPYVQVVASPVKCLSVPARFIVVDQFLRKQFWRDFVL